jgi:hypothetical protein
MEEVLIIAYGSCRAICSNAGDPMWACPLLLNSEPVSKEYLLNFKLVLLRMLTRLSTLCVHNFTTQYGVTHKLIQHYIQCIQVTYNGIC